jgi:hypothetical protein
MIVIITNQLQFRMREGQKGDEIFDSFRKKWVALTPEEWVRQTLLGYLVQTMGYPPALVSVERGIQVGELKRRFDAVVFGRDGKPWMLIECKAPGESIENAAVGQLLAYQSVVGSKYLLLYNGKHLRCWQIIGTNVMELDALPLF